MFEQVFGFADLRLAVLTVRGLQQPGTAVNALLSVGSWRPTNCEDTAATTRRLRLWFVCDLDGMQTGQRGRRVSAGPTEPHAIAPHFNLIGSGVSEPQVAENRHLPLTGGIALTTVYALTCYTVILAEYHGIMVSVQALHRLLSRRRQPSAMDAVWNAIITELRGPGILFIICCILNIQPHS